MFMTIGGYHGGNDDCATALLFSTIELAKGYGMTLLRQDHDYFVVFHMELDGVSKEVYSLSRQTE